ncbi:MAG TPA: 3-methyl-2-oxobutanoate hydroxymethyltransferase, partial [Balneola sp.]|nr:3-methyl-2-oxobutanoate hydroxymethyltransferase [Balneola sp.]
MSTNTSDRPAKITTQTVVDMKQQGEKISMLTAYDFTMAQIIDQAGIEIILVGDSASNVMAGFETTVPMTLDHMIYHTSCVVRGVDRALVIADMPFMSYQVTAKEALINAGRMMK